MLPNKLHPSRFPGMSAKMIAVVGCILGEDWTEPTIAELVITSDGFVLARNAGHVGFNAFIGSATDLQRNWDNLLNVAGLTGEEQREANYRFQEAVKSPWRKGKSQPRRRGGGPVLYHASRP